MNYPTSLTTGTDAQPTEDMFHKYINAWCFGENKGEGMKGAVGRMKRSRIDLG